MHFLITAGGTREYIDPVRFISNASSGKTGYALARAAIKAGHKVTLISTKRNLRKPAKAKVVYVDSSGEMFAAVKKHFEKCNCLIMAAAVCDYTIAKPAKSKIKKTGRQMVIELKPTVDILGWAGRHKKAKGQFLVGFALEDKSIRSRAEGKLKEKKLDMIVANTPAAIGAEKSTVHIKTQDSPWTKIETTSKSTIAKKIIRMVEQCMA